MSDYVRERGNDLGKGSRAVVTWNEGVVFRCPCDERQVYVSSPPHTITFDAAGRLTLDGSVGSRARGGRPANWCHFHIKAGVPTMCGGVKCPGAASA